MNDAIDFIEEDDLNGATAVDVIIEPPGNGLESPADSGDEASPSIQHLSKAHLNTPVQVHFHVPDEEEIGRTNQEAASKWRKHRHTKASSRYGPHLFL